MENEKNKTHKSSIKHDLTGKNIGEWTVIKRATNPTSNKKNSYWECRCSCGKIEIISRGNLTRNKCKISCGCIIDKSKLKKRKKYTRTYHGMNNDEKRFKSIWYGIKERCYDNNNNQYKNYGAKGIYMCDKWLEFEGFKQDMYELYLEFEKNNGEKSATIDRIDNNKPYELSNCRWATQLEQARNRSNNIKVEINGVTYNTLSEVSEAYQINYETIRMRYQRGWRGEKLVKKSNIRSFNSIGTYYSNRKHYEKMKKKRESKLNKSEG